MNDLPAGRRAPLDMDPSDFRALGHDLVDRIADFLGGLGEGPIRDAVRDDRPDASLGVDREMELPRLDLSLIVQGPFAADRALT